MTVEWTDTPAKHDYPAAASYLSLIAGDSEVSSLVAKLKAAPVTTHKAKDILRASGLALLPLDDAHVAIDLQKVIGHVPLSPVLIIRGQIKAGIHAQIADGYHRVCASYHVGENTDIPARIIDL